MSGHLGQHVIYTLGADDATQINRRRADYEAFRRGAHHEAAGESGRNGHQGHFGNPVAEGESYPAVLVRSFGGSTWNLQVHLDGNDTYWATSRSEMDNSTAFMAGQPYRWSQYAPESVPDALVAAEPADGKPGA